MVQIPSGSPSDRNMSVREIQKAVQFLEESLSNQTSSKTKGVALKVFQQMNESVNKGQEGLQILKATAQSIMTKEGGIADFKAVVALFINDPDKRSHTKFLACMQAFRQLEMPVDNLVSEVIAENENLRTNPGEVVDVYQKVQSSMGPFFGQYLVMCLCQYDDTSAAIKALLAHMVQEGLKNLLASKEPPERQIAKRIEERKRLPEKTEELLQTLDPTLDLQTMDKFSNESAVRELMHKLGEEKAYRLYIHFVIEESLGIL